MEKDGKLDLFIVKEPFLSDFYAKGFAQIRKDTRAMPF